MGTPSHHDGFFAFGGRVVQRNLAGLKNVDVIQFSIDAPPLLDQSIEGIIY